MKKTAYETPSVELVLFKTEDIIVTSGGDDPTVPDFGNGGGYERP